MPYIGSYPLGTPVANSVIAGSIAANAVTAFTVADNAIVTGDIVDGAITSVKLATNAVNTGNIADGAITSAKLAANAVSTGNIADGAVTVVKGGTGAATLTANAVLLGNTTSSVKFVSPGTSGNVLTSDGLAWISSAAGGSWELIQSQNVTSAVSAVDFTTGITNKYKSLFCTFENASSGDFSGYLRIRISRGSGFITSNYSYRYGNWYSTSSVVSGPDAMIDTGGFIQTTAPINGYFYILAPFGLEMTISGQLNYTSSSFSGGYFSGEQSGTTPLDGIRFYNSAGNIGVNSVFTLYGLK